MTAGEKGKRKEGEREREREKEKEMVRKRAEKNKVSHMCELCVLKRDGDTIDKTSKDEKENVLIEKCYLHKC
jgi:hypothetical protein